MPSINDLNTPDTIVAQVACPFCGSVAERECLTWSLRRQTPAIHLAAGERVPYFGPDHLVCMARCTESSCTTHSVDGRQYTSLMGKRFRVRLEVKDGVVTGSYETDGRPLGYVELADLMKSPWSGDQPVIE